MRGEHDHQDPHTGERRACANTECRLPFRTPLPKPVVKRVRKPREQYASRTEQYGRYIDCGPSNWDDR